MEVLKEEERQGMTMKEKWKLFQESLTDGIAVSKREFLLITAVCVLGGMVFGLMFSPRKHVMIGSCNGSGNRVAEDQDDEQAEG